MDQDIKEIIDYVQYTPENTNNAILVQKLKKIKGSGNNENYELPIASTIQLGGIKVGNHLLISNDGKLDVDVTENIEQNNMKPITSGAVYREIGNIEALLGTI